MVEKEIRGGICNAINRKDPSYLKYCDVNNLYGWKILQKLPVNKFVWIEETS